jgi:hypothetical protein
MTPPERPSSGLAPVSPAADPDPFGDGEPPVVFPPGLFALIAALMSTMVAVVGLVLAVVSVLVDPQDIPRWMIAFLVGASAGTLVVCLPVALTLYGFAAGRALLLRIVPVLAVASAGAIVLVSLHRAPALPVVLAVIGSAASWLVARSDAVRRCSAFYVRRRGQRLARRRQMAELLSSPHRRGGPVR